MAVRLFAAPRLAWLATQVARLVLDPTTGFLREAPLAPLNGPGGDSRHFNFFARDSPDRQTPFGIALDRFREIVHSQIAAAFPAAVPATPPAPAIFVPSVLEFVQSVVVPPTFRLYDVACGFPTRVEILLLLSRYQDRVTSVKQVKDIIGLQRVRKWSAALNGDSVRPPPVPPIRFADQSQVGVDVVAMRFLRLGPFLSIPGSPFEAFYVNMSVLPIILGPHIGWATFFVEWIQVMLFTVPEVAFRLFDDIIGIYTAHQFMTHEQHFTYLVATARFIQILSLLPTRYLEDEQVTLLSRISFAGLYSPVPKVRQAAYKVSKALTNFESDGKSVLLLSFLENYEPAVQQSLFDRLACDDQPRRIKPLRLPAAMATEDLALWLTVISAYAANMFDYFPSSWIQAEKRHGIEYWQHRKATGTLDIEYHLAQLCFLTPIADFPLFLGRGDADVVEAQSLSPAILEELIDAAQNYWKTHGSLVRVLVSTVNVSAFPVLLDLLEKKTPELPVLAIILRALSWNVNFRAVSEHKDFLTNFLSLFSKAYATFSQLAEMDVPLCLDLLSSFCRILSVMRAIDLKQVDAPFPLCRLVDRTSHSATFLETKPYFESLYKLAKSEIPQVRSSALLAFEAWLSCNRIPTGKVLGSPDFLDKIEEFSRERPKILFYLLVNHFDALLTTYLANVFTSDNTGYFSALAAFFKSDTLSSAITTESVIRNQWLSCCDSFSDATVERYLNSLYNSTGSLILVCLFLLSRSDRKAAEEAFVVLSSLSPILSMVHMGGRSDDVKRLMSLFLQASANMGQSFSSIDMETIGHISSVLSECFQFCMEQLMSDACEFLPKRPPHEVTRVLVILRPWFETLELDLENRVICKETDQQFMRFSCFTFVNSLMASFPESQDANLNSEVFNMWKTLVTTRNRPNANYLPVFLSALYSVNNPENHDNTRTVFQYLFGIAPQLTSGCICSLFSFGASAHNYFRNPEDGFHNQCEIRREENSDLDFGVITPNCSEVISFLLKTTAVLIGESVRPFISSLPSIFAFCLLHYRYFFKLIFVLLQKIVAELLPIIAAECLPFLHEVNRVFTALSQTPQSDDEDSDDLSVVTRVLTDFLQNFDPDMSEQFGMILLQWGMCYGDMDRASMAISAYCGNLTYCNTLIVDLSARALWSLSDAIRFLEPRQVKLDPYFNYMAEQLKMLKCLAEYFAEHGTLGSDSTLLWIAVECLKCNTERAFGVFQAALDLFEFILMYPDIFSFLAHAVVSSVDRFTPGTFRKFHQPWGDSFHGVSSDLFTCTCQSVNVLQLIRVINLAIQTSFVTLFSDSPNAVFVAVLALLPWMWSVVITDISRFMFNSPAVALMEQTYSTLTKLIDNQAILDKLLFVKSGEERDIFLHVHQLCEQIVPLIETSDLVLVIKFFTHTLEFGDKSMISPIYSIVASIVQNTLQKQPILDSLVVFSGLVEHDKNESRLSYRELYLEIYQSATTGQQLAQPEQPVCERWPELVMFERIVAVKIPHLYEVNVSEIGNINIADLNSFPPLMPFEAQLREMPKFKLFFDVLGQYRFEPFMTWWEATNKLLASLISSEKLIAGQQTTQGLLVHGVFKQMLGEVEVKVQPSKDDLELALDEEEEEVKEEPKRDPCAFVFLEPTKFLPGVDEINQVGNELFYDQPGMVQDGF